jgi:hypothetical protein
MAETHWQNHRIRPYISSHDPLPARLAATPIDYSDIPPLGDEFFARTTRMTDVAETTGWGRYTPEHKPNGEEELYYLILRLMRQDCEPKPDTFDSLAISAYEAAIIALDAAGFVEIDKGGGRIYATLTETGRNYEAWMERHEQRKRIAEARHHLATVPGAQERREAVARLYGITLADLDDDQT